MSAIVTHLDAHGSGVLCRLPISGLQAQFAHVEAALWQVTAGFIACRLMLELSTPRFFEQCNVVRSSESSDGDLPGVQLSCAGGLALAAHKQHLASHQPFPGRCQEAAACEAPFPMFSYSKQS